MVGTTKTTEQRSEVETTEPDVDTLAVDNSDDAGVMSKVEEDSEQQFMDVCKPNAVAKPNRSQEDAVGDSHP